MSEHDCQSEEIQQFCGKHHTTEGLDKCCLCYEKWVREHFQLSDLLLGGLTRWVEDGIMPGSFLSSVLLDRPLSIVAGCADERNKLILGKLLWHLVNKCPHQCWGNEERVRKWAAHGGGKGLRGAEQRSQGA